MDKLEVGRVLDVGGLLVDTLLVDEPTVVVLLVEDLFVVGWLAGALLVDVLIVDTVDETLRVDVVLIDEVLRLDVVVEGLRVVDLSVDAL